MKFILLLSLFIFSSCSSSNSLKKKIEQEHFSGTALVTKKGKILLNHGFGEANVEKQVTNSPQTQFLIGSITKMFTAAAVLKLEQVGKIVQTQPVSAYLKREDMVWKGQMPSWADQVTIRQLLIHSSGLEDYTRLPGYDAFCKTVHTPEEVVQFFAFYPLKFQPGTKYDYMGSNYLLLGLIIERVSGKSYGDYLTENFFHPLKMESTKVSCDFVSQLLMQDPLLAIGYNENGQLAGEENLSMAYSEAAIISTTGDLRLWIQGLFGGKVLSKNSLQKMLFPALMKSETRGVGEGVFIDLDHRDQPSYFSLGKISGYTSIWLYDPERESLVILLSNEESTKTFDLGADLLKQIQ